MLNEKVKHSGVPGSVSKSEDPDAGTTADVDKKTEGNVAGGLTGKENLPARPVDEELEINLDEKNESVSEPELENQSRSSANNESADMIKSLEANLAKARNLLTEMQEHAEKTKSELSAKITDLQTQRDSLVYELEQTTKEVNDSKSMEAELRSRLAELESELDTEKVKPEKPGYYVEQEETQVLSEAEISRSDQEFQLDRKKQDDMSVTAEQNREISKLTGYNEGDVKVEETINELQSRQLVDQPEVSVHEDVGTTETEQVELPQRQQVESSIETETVLADEQKHTGTKVEELKPTSAETDASVMLDVMSEEAKTADFPSLTDKIIFIRALSDIKSQDETTRINAVKTIGSIRHELSVKALIAQMTIEPSIQVRTECIKALTALNMKEAVPAIELALTEKAVSVRLAAVRALYRLAGSEGARTLVRMLSDEDPDVRRRTATCISWLGQKDLAIELVPLLDDRSISVRRAAVEAMSNLRSIKVVPALIRHLNDPDKKIRRAINSALETITGRKMGKTFPIDEKSFRCLIARWQQWWKEESGVLF
jgi:hypothetical protein